MSDLRDELDEAMLDDGTDPEGDPDTWRQEDAEYLLRTIAYARRRATNYTKTAAVEYDRIQRTLDEIIGRYRAQWENAEARLDDWTRAQARRDPRRKSWPLLNGEVRLRAGQPSFKVDDNDLLVKALLDEGRDDLVETVTVTRPKVAAIKKEIKLIPMSEGEREGSNPDVEMLYAVLPGGLVLPGGHVEKAAQDKFSYEIAP